MDKGQPSIEVWSGLSLAGPIQQSILLPAICAILRSDGCSRRGPFWNSVVRPACRVSSDRAALAKLLVLRPGHLAHHAPNHCNLWPAVGHQSGHQGQELSQRSLHRGGTEQSGNHDTGASRYSALPDNLWERGASVGIRLPTHRDARLGRRAPRRVRNVLRYRAGLTGRRVFLLSLQCQQKSCAGTVSAHPAERCSSCSHYQSTRWHHGCSRSSSQAAPDVSVERRPGAVHGEKSKLVADLRWRDWARFAAGNELVQCKSEFPVCRSNRQYRNLRLPCLTSQVPAAVVARIAGAGIVYLVSLH